MDSQIHDVDRKLKFTSWMPASQARKLHVLRSKLDEKRKLTRNKLKGYAQGGVL